MKYNYKLQTVKSLSSQRTWFAFPGYYLSSFTKLLQTVVCRSFVLLQERFANE